MYPIKPDLVADCISVRIIELQEALAALTERINQVSVDHLRIIKNKGTFQYYEVFDSADQKPKYIPKKEMPYITLLAQRDYECRLCQRISRQIRTLEQMEKMYRPGQLESAFSSMSLPRQKLVEPRVFSKELIELWQQRQYENKAFDDNMPALHTAHGERVRSKSELLIADSLYRHEIPYRYEFPLRLDGFTEIHPDFMCLNPRTGEEVLWEHLGMLDDPDYAHRAVARINQYARNGYFVGKKLILTYEDKKTPLSTRTVDETIKAYFS